MASPARQLRTCTYGSPIGTLTLASDGAALDGLWMEGQKYFGGSAPAEMTPVSSGDDPVLARAASWLDAYFGGERPSIDALPLAPAGSAFRQKSV